MSKRNNAVQQLFESVAKSLRPPKDLSYSAWAEENFRIPASSSAAPGRFRPWKFQRGILDAIGDPLTPRVSVIKSARTGYTLSLVAGLGAYSVNDPGPMILLMPTDDDARGIAVDEIDPAFNESPALRGIMKVGRFDGRNTLTQRAMMGGGSLKILSAMSPRNLRRHTAKVLFCDEVDGMRVTKEGDPIKLAEKRTVSFADRKIVMGSTPTDEETSIIVKRYNESDQRIFEIPCPHCSTMFELLWEHLDWEEGKPETVKAFCPSCGSEIDESEKPAMVEAGEWRATRPWIKGHAGFRLNALISMFANASWPLLVEEYEKAKVNGPADMQVFQNTVLGTVWSMAIETVTDKQLKERGEDFAISWNADAQEWREDIPAEVAYITAGVDVQIDRLEIAFVGHSANHRWLMGHHVIYGATNLDTTWDELLAVLSTKWRHPLGGEIGISAAAVDSGDGGRTQDVYNFCERPACQAMKIVAIKGDDGPRPVIEASRTRRRNRTSTLYIIGVDQVKTDICVSLPLEASAPQSIRLSNSLTEEFHRQLNSERRVLKYKSGRPVVSFDRVGNRRAEALDSTVYAIAVKNICRINYARRYDELKSGQPARKSLKDLVSKLHG